MESIAIFMLMSGGERGSMVKDAETRGAARWRRENKNQPFKRHVIEWNIKLGKKNH